MSTLLSSAELSSALNLDLCDSEEEDDEEVLLGEMEYEEDPYEEELEAVRPHAGTGGSSKLRARPNNQQT